MKRILLTFSVCILVIACNQNKTSDSAKKIKVENNNLADTMSSPSQKVAAAVVGTSDSLMPDKTTDESWKIAGFTNPSSFKEFFNAFKGWVANDNIDSITAHIKFPLRVCASAENFKKNYSSFFNSEVKKSVQNQDPDRFFANYSGAMTGSGELWFYEIKGKYYVITINNKM